MHNADLQRTNARYREFSARGHIFPYIAQNVLSFYFNHIVLVGKKLTKLIGLMPWLYQYQQSLFIGPIKMNRI